MDFTSIVSAVRADKLACRIFEREGHGKYRDRVRVYRDGRLLFERFCYGEAAGLVFSMWGKAEQPIDWQYDACAHSQKTEVPKALTDSVDGALLFDDKAALWKESEALKTNAANGYSLLAILFGR